MKRKLQPFSFMTDGYFSVGERMVNLYKSSANFTLSEYEGRDEFYSEFYDYFVVLCNEASLNTKDAHIYIQELSVFLQEQMRAYTLTPKMFLLAYIVIISWIEFGQTGTRNSVQCYNSYFGSGTSISTVKEEMSKHDTSDFIAFPFVSPRGLYGLNTFLHCYFNGIFPIGITTNPIAVHGGNYKSSPTLTIGHDFQHHRNVRLTTRDLVKSEYETYQYILNHQEEIGVEKCRGLLFILFAFIHEANSMRKETALRVIKLFWRDWWPMMMDNGYYTPQHFGIEFPTQYFGEEVDLRDPSSDSFQDILIGDSQFSSMKEKYIESFVIQAAKDYAKLLL